MKSNDYVYFSYVERLDDDIMLSAALAAERYTYYTLLSYEEEYLIRLSEFIKDNVNITVCLELIHIPSNVFPNTLRDFIEDVIGNTEAVYYEYDLILNCDREIKGLRKITNDEKFLELVKNDKYEIISDLLKDNNISSNAAGSLINACKILMNVKSDIFRFYSGDSFFKEVENFSKQHSSDLECLKLSEFSELIKRLRLYTTSEFKILNDYLLTKIKELSDFLNIIPNVASDINDLTSRNNFNHDGFPSIFKFISAIHFESALRIRDKNKSNVSFLHAIRSLETYIDGYLIYKNEAVISDCSTLISGIPHVLKDVFLLGGKQVNGVSGKFNVAIDTQGLHGSQIYNEIKEVIRIRNKMLLTHGDIKVCEKITTETIRRVMAIINVLEPKNQLNGFEWGVVRKRLHDILTISFEGIGYDLINEYFNGGFFSKKKATLRSYIDEY